ncbi:uncharacterized protein LOC9639214 isoform X2 [Selaginella moellendorffii]|uniref:uncharacterized protein LOC9639214 isoform X2 n=1 Tax=Selaginella moellendorffii TaxID=88036 RepID=UPI000D1C42CF|nr:uncharacterized protein LOC9639214 isoform X2 [Selaginella moellendorffii]|eukprot:XP_024538276.1 uncharacterized protein LOC9639214 isoform X2 [Selaginella moellendorffii]
MVSSVKDKQPAQDPGSPSQSVSNSGSSPCHRQTSLDQRASTIAGLQNLDLEKTSGSSPEADKAAGDEKKKKKRRRSGGGAVAQKSPDQQQDLGDGGKHSPDQQQGPGGATGNLDKSTPGDPHNSQHDPNTAGAAAAPSAAASASAWWLQQQPVDPSTVPAAGFRQPPPYSYPPPQFRPELRLPTSVIRPTSIPHEKSPFLGRPEEHHGAGLMSQDVTDNGNARTIGSKKAEGKSFVEWRPEMSQAVALPSSSLVLSHGWKNQTASYFTGLNANFRPDMNFPLPQQGWNLPSSSVGLGLHNPGGRENLFLGRPPEQTRVITVVMEGRSIDGRICLSDYDGYGSFAAALRSMFGSEEEASTAAAEQACSLSNAIPHHIIAYEDAEGDLLLAGDLSWRWCSHLLQFPPRKHCECLSSWFGCALSIPAA